MPENSLATTWRKTSDTAMTADNIILPSASHDMTVTLLVSILEHLNEPWGLKSADSRHLYMNPAARFYTATPQNFGIEGRYDEEFPAGWAESASELKEHDRQSWEARAQVAVIETDYWYGNNHLAPFISEKIPVFNAADEPVCIMWNARPLNSLSPLKFISTQKPSVLTTATSHALFSEPELNIIFLLLQRYSVKEIARLYNMSDRTISNRVQELYYKAGVHSRRQFEEYCQQAGLDSFLPARLLKKGVFFI